MSNTQSKSQSNTLIRRPETRAAIDLRPIKITPNVNRYAEGSVLIEFGNTHVLCTASIDEKVPEWLKGKGKGWITAEYSMLPRATHTRSKRDREKVSGRTQEIQRLIGRSLRACVDLTKLGERQIVVDCDVIQADGGTRTAAITGGCVALGLALKKFSAGLLKTKSTGAGFTIPEWNALWVDTVAAVSIGLKSGQVLVDLDYEEDVNTDVDMNFVFTGKGALVETQGTGENTTFTLEQMNEMAVAAQTAVGQLKIIQSKLLY